MKAHFTFRNHFKNIGTLHIGFNISTSLIRQSFAAGISISLLFITIGFMIWKVNKNTER